MFIMLVSECELSKYSHTVNCRSIEVSDFEICIYKQARTRLDCGACGVVTGLSIPHNGESKEFVCIFEG